MILADRGLQLNRSGVGQEVAQSPPAPPLASRKGFEPLTYGLGNRCSILLSYREAGGHALRCGGRLSAPAWQGHSAPCAELQSAGGPALPGRLAEPGEIEAIDIAQQVDEAERLEFGGGAALLAAGAGGVAHGA